MSGKELILEMGQKLYGPKFKIEKEQHEPYKLIFENFMSRLNSKEPEKIKSLGLVGPKGVSKSSIMRIMHILFKDTPARFKSVTAQHLILLMDDLSTAEIIDLYGNNDDGLYIDDIGLKKDAENKKWGNSVNLIAEIMEARYNRFVRNGTHTDWSSNLPPEINREKILCSPTLSDQQKNELLNSLTLSDIYGERIADRMIEQNQIIKFKGKSLRNG